MSLWSGVEHFFGINTQPPQPPLRRVPLDTGGTQGVHPPLQPQQVMNANAQFAAEGARMYNAAHPGQRYTPGQNGETYPGGLSYGLYQSLAAKPLQVQTIPPLPPVSLPRPAVNQINQVLSPFQGIYVNPQMQSPYSQQNRYNSGVGTIQPQGSTPRIVNTGMYFE